MGSSEADLARIDQIRPVISSIGALFTGIAVILGFARTFAALS